MKIFGMPLIHADMWELLFKFGVNTLVLFVLIRLIYYPIHRKKDYLFTYFLFNTLIFFLCVLLNSVKLSIGFAFGLFAIFGVLRYRTEQISIKDMTYHPSRGHEIPDLRAHRPDQAGESDRAL